MKVFYKKHLISLFLLCFISALFLAALHHHDNSFRVNTCSLCKINSSLSIAAKKVNLDNSFALPFDHITALFNHPAVSGRIIEPAFFRPFSTTLYSITNKAPPFQS
jgi:hypothetical protein